MAETNLGLMDAIEIAMHAEKQAHEFYLDAVNQTKNDRGRNLMQQLAKFELNHYNKLQELKSSLEKDGTFIDYEGTEFEPFKQDYSEISTKIEPNRDDVLSVLTLAIEAETKAHDHYRKLAHDTSDPRGKEMFFKLAEEEKLHRRILSDEFYQMSNQGGIWFWGD